jgi:hypothetical protein
MRPELRPRRIPKPSIRRPAVVLFLAAAGALTVAGIALAAASSTSSFSVRCDGRALPRKCPQSTYTKARLNIHTHTSYTNPGGPNGGKTKRIQMFFDNDFRFDPSVTPRCDPNLLFGRDMAGAMANCGASIIGSGTGQAVTSSTTIHACALLFNGINDGNGDPQVDLYFRLSTVSTISCADPVNNHEGNTTVVLLGTLRTVPIGDYRREIDIPNLSSVPLPVSDLNLNFTTNSDGITSGYVRARCFDADRVWNVTTYFTYNDNSTQTVNSTRTCTVG